MALDAIVRQHKPFVLTGQDGSFDLPAFDLDVLAGSTIALLIGLEKGDTGQTVLLDSVSGGGTWVVGADERSSGDSIPNAAGAYVEGVSAGPLTVTIGVNQTSAVRATGVLVELRDMLTPSGLDKYLTEANAGASALTNQTGTTGTLAQAQQIVLVGNFGYNGVNTPLGGAFADLLNHQNGVGGGLGGYAAYCNVSATDALNVTFTHSASDGGSCVLMSFKGAAEASVKIQVEGTGPCFQTSFTDGEMLVWVNGAETAVLPHLVSSYSVPSTGLAEATSDLPPGLELGDTIRVLLRDSSGVGATTGIGVGTVVAA